MRDINGNPLPTDESSYDFNSYDDEFNNEVYTFTEGIWGGADIDDCDVSFADGEVTVAFNGNGECVLKRELPVAVTSFATSVSITASNPATTGDPLTRDIVGLQIDDETTGAIRVAADGYLGILATAVPALPVQTTLVNLKQDDAEALGALYADAAPPSGEERWFCLVKRDLNVEMYESTDGETWVQLTGTPTEAGTLQYANIAGSENYAMGLALPAGWEQSQYGVVSQTSQTGAGYSVTLDYSRFRTVRDDGSALAGDSGDCPPF